MLDRVSVLVYLAKHDLFKQSFILLIVYKSSGDS